MKGSKWWNFNLLKPHLAAVSVVQYCSAFYAIDQPQSIRPLCAERIDRAVKWLLVQMALQPGRQTILAYVEIYRIVGNIDVHAMRWVDQRAAAIWAMRSGFAPASSRRFTSSVPVTLAGVGTAAGGLASSIRTCKNSILSKLGKTNLPIRAIRRQSETVLAFKSYLLATTFTASPLINFSATTRVFSSVG